MGTTLVLARKDPSKDVISGTGLDPHEYWKGEYLKLQFLRAEGSTNYGTTPEVQGAGMGTAATNPAPRWLLLGSV